MKRYLVFSGKDHYPRGGWEDFVGSFDTIDECGKSFTSEPNSWMHIVDSNTGEVVARVYSIGGLCD